MIDFTVSSELQAIVESQGGNSGLDGCKRLEAMIPGVIYVPFNMAGIPAFAKGLLFYASHKSPEFPCPLQISALSGGRFCNPAWPAGTIFTRTCGPPIKFICKRLQCTMTLVAALMYCSSPGVYQGNRS